MYIGHGRLCVCLTVCLSLAAFPHYHTDPDVTWCPVVVHYWADLQAVHGFRCYGNSVEREMSASACAWFAAVNNVIGLHVGVNAENDDNKL